MKKETYIYIQEPCHENWSSMTTAEQGRFCGSCQKTVTDFSQMTDMEILQFLAAGNGNTCGRFATDQVNRAIHAPASPARKTVWAYLLSMLMPVLVAGRLQAQNKRPTQVQTEQTTTEKPAKRLPTLEHAPMEVVTDTVKLKNGKSATDGELPAGPMPKETTIMGLIIAFDKVTAVDTAATFVKKAMKNELFSVYPNPATKGKKVSIKVNKAGTFAVHLLSAESAMITYATATVGAKGEMIFFDVPAGIASGTYYLRLVQEGKDVQFVDKLVVR